jgi:hypothetical protein
MKIIVLLALWAIHGHAHHTAVMIHGCHLEAKAWERIVFGTQQEWGRVPTGLREAFTRNAQAIFWGTGASEVNGVREAQATYDLTVGEKLHELSAWLEIEPDKLKQSIERLSHIDTKSQNTAEELAVALNTCHELGITHLILISSPTHIARCLQEACKIDSKGVTIYATASQTCFEGSTAGDVTIFEPPHRPESFDLPPFYKTVKRIFGFYRTPELAWEFHRDFDALLMQYESDQQRFSICE